MGEAGVCLHLNQSVTPVMDGENPVFVGTYGDKARKGGVWCSSPTTLQLKLRPTERLENSPMPQVFWHIQVKQPDIPKFSYVQFFGHPSRIIRSTGYVYNGEQHAVVEGVRSRKTVENGSLDRVFESVQELGLEPIGLERERNSVTYPLVSESDAVKLRELERQLQKSGWIHGGWLSNGRAAKVNSILKQFEAWARDAWT